ncbi:MAG: amidohydrolase [Gemmatimonadales bacterium]
MKCLLDSRPLRVAPLALALAGACRSPGVEADLIVENARIWTADSTSPWAEALAARGERLLAVGSTAEARRHRTANTRVIDAGGRLVTPGFIDNHTHFGQAGGLLLGLNLLDVATADSLVARIRAAMGRLPAGAWVTGGDWGAYEDWAAGSTGGSTDTTRRRFDPDRSLLDSITPTTGLLIQRWDRSAHLANGVALAAAGLDCGRPVAGLECEGGAPTGRVEGDALARLRAVVPAKSFDQRLREARAALAHLAELGVTGIDDVTPPEQLPVFHELHRRGELTVRVYARPTLDQWDELAAVGVPAGFGDAWLRIGGLKGFVDGIQGNSTARFYEPQLHSGKRGEWRDSTNTGASAGPGSGMEPAGNMERNLLGADRVGLWPQVHAIGDQAIDTLLSLFEKVVATNPPRERRFRIIHSQVLRGPEVASRYAALGVIAEVQPYHAIDDMRWMEERIGERSRWAYAFKTLHDAGVLLTFGSDWPGTNASWYTADPMKILYAALTRRTLDGEPEGGWFPEERLDLETALRAYAVNNAWAEGAERDKGRLATRMLADFVVLDQDLFEIPAERVKDTRAVLTVVGGRVTFERGDGSTTTATGDRR